MRLKRTTTGEPVVRAIPILRECRATSTSASRASRLPSRCTQSRVTGELDTPLVDRIDDHIGIVERSRELVERGLRVDRDKVAGIAIEVA
jgi:hypothetical protein